MKKALSLLLALVFALSLCACGSKETYSTPTVSNTLPTPTEPPAVESKYVGNWVATAPSEYGGDVSSFIRFLSNDQAIFGLGDGSDDTERAYAGQWFAEGNKIYLTYTKDGVGQAYIFTICDGYIEGYHVCRSKSNVRYFKVN